MHIDSIYKYKYFIESFADNADVINDNLKLLRGKKKSEIDYNDYYKLYTASLNLIDFASTFTDLPYVNTLVDTTELFKIKRNTTAILSVARSAGELYVDVRTKNYSSAIVNSVTILDALLNFNMAFESEKLRRDYDIANGKLKTVVDSIAIKECKKRKIRRFIRNIDYQDITNANGNYTLTLNLIKGNKNLKGVTLAEAQEQALKDVLVAKLNIGTSEQKDAIRNKILKYGSFIFSPGAFISIGIPKAPISFNIGWQVTPFITKVTASENTFQPSMFRFSMGICVDMPMFNLWSRPFKK